MHLATVEEVARAILTMQVRGAAADRRDGGLWCGLGNAGRSVRRGAGACGGISRKAAADGRESALALEEMRRHLAGIAPSARAEAAFVQARDWRTTMPPCAKAIGAHGLRLIADIAARKAPGEPVNVLTHCNAVGSLAWTGEPRHRPLSCARCGLPVHVWVDETRPRNQGAALTAFELGSHGCRIR